VWTGRRSPRNGAHHTPASKDETAKKLQHALQHGPLTCNTIRYDKGGEGYCRACQHWGKVKSPIVLAMPRLLVSKDSQNGTTPSVRPGLATQQALDAAEVAQQAADALLHTLPTLADDAKEEAVLDALPALAPLDTLAWMRLKRQLNARSRRTSSMGANVDRESLKAEAPKARH
jgi:hypothetical protein